MTIHAKCPQCGAVYVLDDDLQGKRARCRKCRHKFMMPAPMPEIQFEEVTGDEPEPIELEPPAFTKLHKKKRRKRPVATFALWQSGLLDAVVLVLLAVVCGAAFYAGSASRARQLVGKWKGAPDVRAVTHAPPVLRGGGGGAVAQVFLEGAAKMVAQGVANQALAIAINFKSNGNVSFSGATDSLNVPNNSDGRWEVVRSESDMLIVKMGPAGGQFEAKLVFSDKDDFTLTRADKPGFRPIMFSRD